MPARARVPGNGENRGAPTAIVGTEADARSTVIDGLSFRVPERLDAIVGVHGGPQLAVPSASRAATWPGIPTTVDADAAVWYTPAFDTDAAHARAIAASFAKRCIDVVGAVAGLIVAAPVLLAIALIIALVDGRPILFTQPRAGLRGRPFEIMKFRTMERGADVKRGEMRSSNEISGGASFKVTRDPRVTTLGAWLRRTSIDELPQLWNVLRGEMSLVGPRPHPFDDVAGYRPWHFDRLAVKPGMTGLWQVELRGDTDFDRWVRKDLEYIATWSVVGDIKLILKTLPAVVRGTGR